MPHGFRRSVLPFSLLVLAASTATASAQPNDVEGTHNARALLATTASPTVWTLYVGASSTSVRTGATNASTFITSLKLGTPVTAVLGSGSTAGWAQLRSGTYAGRWVDANRMTTTDPAHPVANITGPSPVAASTSTVTRYVVSGDVKPNIRSTASYLSSIVAVARPGTAFTGRYVNYAWFHITSGAYAGRYITAGLLQTSATLSSYNGRMRTLGMCQITATAKTTWEPTTPRYLACPARDALTQLNTAFKAKFGVPLAVDEGYRTLVKQQFFYALLGPQTAATPGRSSHGLAAAVDFDTAKPAGRTTSRYYWGTPEDTWLTANSVKYGFQRPSWYAKPTAGSEYWHYNFVG